MTASAGGNAGALALVKQMFACNAGCKQTAQVEGGQTTLYEDSSAAKSSGLGWACAKAATHNWHAQTHVKSKIGNFLITVVPPRQAAAGQRSVLRRGQQEEELAGKDGEIVHDKGGRLLEDVEQQARRFLLESSGVASGDRVIDALYSIDEGGSSGLTSTNVFESSGTVIGGSRHVFRSGGSSSSSTDIDTTSTASREGSIVESSSDMKSGSIADLPKVVQISEAKPVLGKYWVSWLGDYGAKLGAKWLDLGHLAGTSWKRKHERTLQNHTTSRPDNENSEETRTADTAASPTRGETSTRSSSTAPSTTTTTSVEDRSVSRTSLTQEDGAKASESKAEKGIDRRRREEDTEDRNSKKVETNIVALASRRSSAAAPTSTSTSNKGSDPAEKVVVTKSSSETYTCIIDLEARALVGQFERLGGLVHSFVDPKTGKLVVILRSSDRINVVTYLRRERRGLPANSKATRTSSETSVVPEGGKPVEGWKIHAPQSSSSSTSSRSTLQDTEAEQADENLSRTGANFAPTRNLATTSTSAWKFEYLFFFRTTHPTLALLRNSLTAGYVVFVSAQRVGMVINLSDGSVAEDRFLPWTFMSQDLAHVRRRIPERYVRSDASPALRNPCPECCGF
ncbi:unnamed protein product [Amoebophrya sp. A25]|nr:unnamed protein product [Amoebophrya sp. A25]|eukprot:GSA25T00020158001.1